MLAGVDQDLLMLLTEFPQNRGALDELGPGTDNRDYFHDTDLLIILVGHHVLLDVSCSRILFSAQTTTDSATAYASSYSSLLTGYSKPGYRVCAANGVRPEAFFIASGISSPLFSRRRRRSARS